MLVITRREGEGINLFDKASGKFLARVIVVMGENYRARLGINAPPEILVLRDELCNAEGGMDVRDVPEDQGEK